jgi:hypothetical protein
MATVAKQAAGTADHLFGTILDCALPHVGAAVVWVMAVATGEDPVMVMAGALTGGITMGWAFAFSSASGAATRAYVFKRCGIHAALGIFIGIFLAYHYGGLEGPFPHVPLWAISALASGLSGAVMVAILPFLPGMTSDIVRWAKRRFLGIEVDERPKTNRHPDVPFNPLPKKDISGDETQRIQ